MKRRLALGMAMLVLGYSASAGEPKSASATLTVEQARQKLVTTELFAFGGVGFAGTISEGERAFKVLASCTNAVELFTEVLAKAKPEGQMYALCGIHRLAPKKFEALAKPIINANPEVSTMSGCLAMQQRATNVVASIASGRYAIHDENVKVR